MTFRFFSALAAVAAFGLTARAEVLTYDFADLTTPPSIGDEGNNGNTPVGVWVLMEGSNSPAFGDVPAPGLAGAQLIVNDDPTNFFPLIDGLYQFRWNTWWEPDSSDFLVFGLFERGNDALGANNIPGVNDGNVARLQPGDTFGPDNFIPAGFVELAGSFGNFNPDKGRGIVGLRFPIGDNLHYGWIDLTIAPTGQITVHGAAYESQPNAPVTVSFIGEGGIGVPVDFATTMAEAGLEGDAALLTADPDQDGASNLLEYALNGNASSTDIVSQPLPLPVPPTEQVGPRIEVSFPVNPTAFADPDVSYRVLYGSSVDDLVAADSTDDFSLLFSSTAIVVSINADLGAGFVVLEVVHDPANG